MVTFASLICGALFGVAFGLTGAGSVFAVPLLVYVLGLPPHQAVCVAMVSVNALALVSGVRQLGAREAVVADGVRMAAMGILGAPLGAWVGRSLTDPWLMIIFGGFAVAILAVAGFILIRSTR